MNFNRFFLMFLLLFLINGTKAQDFCKTLSNDANSLKSIDTRFISSNGPFTVRVFFHIIRRTNGTGGQANNIINNALNILIADYAASNVGFTLLGSDFIDSDDFFNFVDDETCSGCTDCDFAQLTATNTHANAIDVYILPANVFNAGRANGIPGSALVIGGSATFNGITSNLANSHVISHEMGHCLGLFHTFHGTCTCENRDCSGNTVSCPELVNGSNGATCGDFVADSPADPDRLFSFTLGNTCTWNNTTRRDANNQLYNPDETIIMAYTYPQCMAIFTNGQGERMRNHLVTSPLLQPRILPSEIFIQNETFSSGQQTIEAIDRIVAGNNVTTGTQGDVTINNSAVVEFRSHGEINLQPGVIIKPNANGRFFTTLINDQPLRSASFKSALINDNYYLFLNNSSWFSVQQGFEGYINSLFSTVGDKIVNELHYYKIKESFIELANVHNDPSIKGSGSEYFLREDLQNKKVFKLNQDNSEELFYDFSLAVNSKLPLNNSFTLFKIDTVTISVGERKRFVFKDVDKKEVVWIEGVGNISNPFIPDAIFEDRQKLICSYQNNIVIYDNGEVNNINCTLYKSSVQKISDSKISTFTIYPNPTKGCFRISINSRAKINSIKLIDVNGKTVSNIGNILDLSYLDLDISSLITGLYFCVISSENQINTLKIIKE